MITEAAINQFLKKLQDAPDERLTAYSELYEDLFPGEKPEQKWHQLDAADGPALRAAVRMGLIVGEHQAWIPDYPDEYVPAGADYVVTLSGLGTEKLLVLNEPFLPRAMRQLRQNLPTIFTSVLISFFAAWALYLWGPGAFTEFPDAQEVPVQTN